MTKSHDGFPGFASRGGDGSTATSAIRVLLVEDNPADALMLKQTLAEAGVQRFAVTHVESMSEAMRVLASEPFDAVLLDLSLPDSRGLCTVEQASEVAPALPIVVLTGFDDEATAIEVVRRGAQDFLIKGQSDGRLVARAIRYAMERKQSEQQLKALNESLEHRVAERTAVATRRAAQLRALASELTLAEQRERRRLAEILHDRLQQLLYAARLNLGGVRRGTLDPELCEVVERIDGLLGEAIAESRSLTMELSPPVVYVGAPQAALEWLARHLDQTCGLAVEIEACPGIRLDSEDLRILLFQSVRELLFNVVKHAGTSRARVSMKECDGDRICVEVADEGVGFDMEQPRRDDSGGFGLFSIRERLELLGGSMEVVSAPGRGTRVTILTPCRPSRRAESNLATAAARIDLLGQTA